MDLPPVGRIRADPPDAWAALADACRRDLPDLPAETIGEAEFVWYEGGVEHAEVIRLGVGG